MVIIMLNINVRKQVIKIINKAIPVIRSRCKQFASIIIHKTNPICFPNSLAFIQNGLFDFSHNVCKSFFKRTIESVKYSMASLNSQRQIFQEKMAQQINSLAQSPYTLIENKIFMPFQQEQLPIDEQKQGQTEISLFQKVDENLYRQHINECDQKIQKIICQIQAQLKNNKYQQMRGFKQDLMIDLADVHEQKQNKKYNNEQMNGFNQQLKQKKKKQQQERTENINNHERQQQSQLKLNYYNQILQIRQKYINMKSQFFKEELQIFWPLRLTIQQVSAKIMNFCQIQLNQLGQKLKQWANELQKRFWKFDQKCYIHKQKIFYLCSNETRKQKGYLCNKCLSKESMFQHEDHEIVCQRHRKSIKYKFEIEVNIIKLPQSSCEQQQIFMCQQCAHFASKKNVFVSCCHFQKIVSLCIEPNCIKFDDFMICPTCDKHENHRRIQFDCLSLMNQFGLKDNVDITRYQQQLIKSKQNLKLNPFQKIRISYAKHILPTMRFLQSFGVYDNKKVEEWINCLMSEGKSQDLMVLVGVLKMKEKNFSDSDKLNYLESFNLMQEKLEGMFNKIWDRLSQCCKKINELENISEYEEIAQELNSKYEQIIDIETEQMSILTPMRASDINQIHHNQIKKITVKKDKQEQKDQKIRKEWREKRGIFFRQQLKKKLCSQNVWAQQRKQIIELFISTQQNYKNQLKMNLEKLGELKQYRIVIQLLQQQYNKINKSLRAKLRECLPWRQIMSNSFVNIKVIHIQYNLRYKYNYLDEQYYCISSFELFKLIHYNHQLEQVTVRGVQILEIEQFMVILNPINNTQQIKRSEELRWMKLFSASHLRITLDCKYQLHPYILHPHEFNTHHFLMQLENLMNFRYKFQQISQIVVKVRFKAIQWGSILKKLILCLKIYQCNHLLLKQLLDYLSSFTTIISLKLYYIQFSPSVIAAEFQQMKNIFSLLFCNNTVTHITLFWCNNFPSLPKITTLSSIQLINVRFREEIDLNEFINSNQELKSIDVRSIKYKLRIEEKLLNQLQNLSIYQCKDVSFSHFQSVQPSKLKYLEINNRNQTIDANTLQSLFVKLANLTQLILKPFDFNYQILSYIPSPYLQELYMRMNKKITDEDLQRVDTKWPYLRFIQLRKCPKISEKFISLCKLKSLMEIGIDKSVLSTSGKKYLKNRGIWIQQF